MNDKERKRMLELIEQALVEGAKQLHIRPEGHLMAYFGTHAPVFGVEYWHEKDDDAQIWIIVRDIIETPSGMGTMKPMRLRKSKL